MTSDDLLAYLADQHISATTHDHPAVHTVEDSRRLRGDIPGIHTKNLFLRDSKKTFFLVVADEAATVNLKDLRHKIGAKGNLSFGAADVLLDMLGVTPGSISLLALVNDATHNVTLVVDQSLLAAETINCHPLSNRRTTSLSAEALRQFLANTGHSPLSISLDGK
ncbi:MAG TPA: prolyl-tRNA synthetase associated domain-containing protein [Rhodopseudomonas sp.]|uniref:prolyl-tRNA synthetase associated domain-containing protein n=1 Tax=Rhodopseudomonas sp. TaxID=1078 RepID=UPI002EDA9122